MDRGAYEDYVAGKLWITWAPRKRILQPPATKAEALPPDITDTAILLRDTAVKQGLYATLQAHYPGAQVEIPYKQRMCDKSIDEISLSVRSSNGLMRANAGTFGRLWDLMNRENGLRAVRNLGAKSEAEIFALSAYYLSDAIVHTANGASELFYWNKKEAYTLYYRWPGTNCPEACLGMAS